MSGAALQPMPSEDERLLVMALRIYFAEIVPDTPPDPVGVAADYFGYDGRHPYWIQRNGARAGFALAATEPDGCHELAEFTVFPAHRRSGIGQSAAAQLFARHPGAWRLGVVAHGGARGFWQTALTGNPRLRDLKTGPGLTPAQSHSYTFRAEGEI
ncbi:MAG: GNAT family N-acetyltransferase [Pseudomonadota bacterium]